MVSRLKWVPICLSGKEIGMSENRNPERLKNSIALVKRIVDHIFINNKSIDNYGLKNSHPSYEVWVEHKDKNITVQSFTSDMILNCTDPDEITAMKFQKFIENCIRRGTDTLITSTN